MCWTSTFLEFKRGVLDLLADDAQHENFRMRAAQIVFFRRTLLHISEPPKHHRVQLKPTNLHRVWIVEPSQL